MDRLMRAAAMVGLLAGCSSSTEPQPGPPFLAIVIKLEEGTAQDSAATYSYRVRNLSVGTTPLDTVIHATPADTVVLPLPASTYSVLLDSLPPTCSSRRGNEEVLVLDPQTNTGLARFHLFCHASLTVAVTTQGPTAAAEYVWEVSDGAGFSRSGVVDATGAAAADGLPEGDYRVRLALVSPGCIATGPGGLSQRIHVPPDGGVTVRFRIVCSDPATAPAVRDFRWSYHDSTAAFVATITDVDRNVANYTFDLTDCAGASVLPDGPIFLDHLDAGRTARLDTMVVLGALALGLTADEAAGRCASFRVEDLDGNTSVPVERSLVDGAGSPPTATSFNGVLNGETLLHVALTVDDPDGDFVGTFAQLRLRDGVLRAPDGVDDLVDFVPQGLLGASLPDVPLGSRFLFTDVYAVIVYLIDAQGHFVRLEDPDTFQ